MNSVVKIKVLIVMPRLAHGGAEMLVRYMFEHGLGSEFDVTLCLLGRSWDTESEAKLRELGVVMHILDIDAQGHLSTMVRLCKLVRSIAPDIVHTHLYALAHSIFATFFARTAVRVHTIHNIAWHEGSFAMRASTRIACKVFGFVLPGISDSIARTIRSYHNVKDVPVLVNGIPIDDNVPDRVSAIRGDLGLSANDFVCINVASFFARKNHAMLIDAFARAYADNPSLVLLLVGDGPLRLQIEAMVESAGISGRVKFLGLRDDVSELLHASNLFVLSSLWEGLPISVLEAMAAGLPVVATDVGGMRDIVYDKKWGMIVPSENTAEFSVAMISIASDPERAIQMGRLGQSFVRDNYSINVTVAAHEALYRDLYFRAKR